MTILLPAAPPSAPAASSRAATTTADPADAAAFASHLASARGELAAQTPESENAPADERGGRADDPTADAAVPLTLDLEVPASLQAAIPPIPGAPVGAGLVTDGIGAAAVPSGDAAPGLVPSTTPLGTQPSADLGDGSSATAPSIANPAVSTPSPVPGSAPQPGLGPVAEASVIIVEAPAATLAQGAAARTSGTLAPPAAPSVSTMPGQAVTSPVAEIPAAAEAALVSVELSAAAERLSTPGTVQRESAAEPSAPVPTSPVAETPRATDATLAAAARPATETRPDSTADAAPAAEAPDPLAPISAGQLRSSETATRPTVAAPARTMGEQLVRPLLTLRTAPGGEHVFTVQVTPEALGPVTMRAHVSADGVRIELVAANDQAREALKALLPDLRRDLSQGGLSASLDLSAGQREAARGELGQRDLAQGSSAQRDSARQETPSRPRESAATETPHNRYQGSGASASIDVLA